jgi:prophage regulatory protein
MVVADSLFRPSHLVQRTVMKARSTATPSVGRPTDGKAEPQPKHSINGVFASSRAWPSEGFIRQKQLIPHFIPISPATLWRWVKTNRFPAPVKLSEGVTAWNVRAVLLWMEGHNWGGNLTPVQRGSRSTAPEHANLDEEAPQ